jgi:5-methylcytosine-specific restriction endonuclease McrA
MIHEPIIKRSVAMAMGFIYYHNGKPCPKGHLAERFVSTGMCRICLREKTKEWQALEKNKEFNRKYAKEWAANNPERVAANKRAWVLRNAASLKIRYAKYASGRRVERCMAETRRRVRKHQSKGNHTAQEIQQLLEKQKFRCPYCQMSIRNGYHIDHINPLCLGGSNAIENIQLLCPPCNLRKSRKPPERFAREIGLLL